MKKHRIGLSHAARGGSRLKKLVAAGLVALALACAPTIGAVPHAYADQVASDAYQLYPTPHSMVYGKGAQTLRSTAQVYATPSIDQATRDRLDETLTLKGMKAQSVDAIPTAGSTTSILVGIQGSGDAVDTYVSQLVEQGRLTLTDGLFDKTDAYLLASLPAQDANEPDQIIVLGKNVDAAFYGITSLYQIFQQIPGASLKAFTLCDYADVTSRGFIEGYYGDPWSTEDRVKLMEWGGYYKQNAYFYAPKDDPKHNAKWWELYTDEEIQTKVKPLADAGERSKCHFVFALHPFMNNPITPKNYDQKVNDLKAKFLQVIDKAGVRQIAILADDAGNQGNDLYVKLCQDITNWLHDLQKQTGEDGALKYPGLKDTLIFCPVNYMSWGEGWYSQLPENVQVINTGGEVWGTVNNNFTANFTKNSNGVAPFMWINWPCTDNTKSGLIMGGHNSFLGNDVQPGNLKGLVLNPMQQSEPSKQAIFMESDFTWNLWDGQTDTDKIWQDSFSYVDHNSPIATNGSNALRELSKHMMESARKGGDQGESAEVKDQLLSFQDKLNAGTVTPEDFDAVSQIFKTVQDAATTYRAQAGNKRMFDQIHYWIDAADDMCRAMLAYCDAGKAGLAGNTSELVSKFSEGQTHQASYGTHGFHYVDHTEYAKVGINYLTPTLNALGSYLAAQVQIASDPNAFVMTYVSDVFTRPSEGKLSNITDGNPGTSAVFKEPNFLYKGNYIGVTFNRPQDVNDVTFAMGSGKNHMYYGQLQVTYDGQKWQNVEGKTFQTGQTSEPFTYKADNLQLKQARGVRLIATKDNGVDLWLSVSEISVNSQDETPAPGEFTIKLDQITDSQYSGSTYANLADGDMGTIAYLYSTAQRDKLRKNSGVELDFKTPTLIDGVSIAHDPSSGDRPDKDGMVFQYKTKDSNEWKNIASFDGKNAMTATLDHPVEATAVRAWITKDKETWWRIAEFQPIVHANSAENVFTNLDGTFNAEASEGSVKLSDTTVTLGAGDYLGLDLGTVRSNVEVKLASKLAAKGLFGFGRAADVKIQTSQNGLEFSDYQAGKPARYVVVRNAGDAEAKEVAIKGLSATYTAVSAPHVIESSLNTPNNPDRMIDNDLKTIGGYNNAQTQGATITFDLGRERTINTVRYEIPETSWNFLRSAVVEVAQTRDAKEWTQVLSINSEGEYDTNWNEERAKTQKWLTHDSQNPGNMYCENKLEKPVSARYMRIRINRGYEHRWIEGDLIINGGQYTSPYVDSIFTTDVPEVPGKIPTNMIDGNLATDWTPSKDAGSITYNIDAPLNKEGTAFQGIRIISNGKPSGATVSAKLYTDGTYTSVKEVKLGSLNSAISEFRFDGKAVKSVTVSWNKTTPSLSEIYLLDNAPAADTKALQALYDQVKDTDTSTWTKDSAANFASALNVAHDLLSNAANATADYVTSVTSALQSAFDGKVLRYTDHTLKDLVDEGQISNDTMRYTSTSYQTYAEAYAAASKALEDADNLSVEQGKALADSLSSAKQGLAFNPTVAERAQAMVADAQRFLDGSYTEDSFAAFKTALDKLNTLVQAHTLDPESYGSTLDDLSHAQASLVDTSALIARRAEFEATTEGAYTPESFASYRKAYDDSTALLKNGNAEQIAKAVEALDTARGKLELYNLDAVIADAEKLNEADYTAASWKVFSEALEAARANKDDAYNATLGQALIDAQAKLVNIRALNEAIARAEGVDRNAYTADSLKALDEALGAAKALLANGSQEQVDVALKALNDAWQNLVPQTHTFTVTFEDWLDSTENPVITVAFGQTVQAPADPACAGYAFGGWYLDAACKVKFDFSTPITDNLTLYAKWTKVDGTPDGNTGNNDGNTAKPDGSIPQTGDPVAIVGAIVVIGAIVLGAGIYLRRRK